MSNAELTTAAVSNDFSIYAMVNVTYRNLKWKYMQIIYSQAVKYSDPWQILTDTLCSNVNKS